MWIYKALIVTFILVIKVNNIHSASATFCAYKDDNFVVNTTSSPGDWNIQEIIEGNNWQKGHGTTIENGYQQCDNTQTIVNHCYTLWASEQESSNPDIIKQGCWKGMKLTSECQETVCDLSTSQVIQTRNVTIHFCCCRGNKCNQGSPARQGEQGNTGSQDDTDNVVPDVVDVVKKFDTKVKTGNEYRRCAYRSPDQRVDATGKMTTTDTQGLGKVQADGRTALCLKNNFCFSYYTIDPHNKSKITIEYQGCWDSRDNRNTCDQSECTPHVDTHFPNKITNNSHFCCCAGDMCNNNISKYFIPYVHATTESSGPAAVHLYDPSYKERTIMISLLSVFSMAIIILTVYLVYRFCFNPTHLAVRTTNVDVPDDPTFDIDDLKISCLISKGRYSEVWKGTLNESDVAVKMYTSSYRQYYHNEKYIYSLPKMEHENVLKFYGGEERIMQDGNSQYLLVLQYAPDGTLMNYLKNNTIDWYTMCKMCQSVAKGMAHLHTDMGTGDDFKPTVAHRDINSRNILMKPDNSCIIADLGFCMTALGSKLIHKNYTENAEQTSLIDVGTLRYMAPELLDGAVNLRDCEASLKQIDMYSIGLVLWEIASRCTDLYQGCPMPEFSLPFQAESGPHPSFEEMQLMVSRNKIRPKFPEVWKDYNQAIRALKETIEECWDHDAEARLTALCVEERVTEMKMLWSHDNRNKGVTPTINTALLSHPAHSNRISCYHGNGHTNRVGLGSMSDSSSTNVLAEGSTSALIINDIRDTSSSMSQSESVSTLPPTWMNDRSGSFSTSTMETTLGQTPGEGPVSYPKSQNINALMNQPIPAHQGRNPIVERNTHKRSDEELAVVGNNLLYGKDRHDPDCLQSPVGTYDSLADSLETSLMQNDVLNHHRTGPQGSYLQNQGTSGNMGRGDLPAKVVNQSAHTSQKQDNIMNANTHSKNTNTPKMKGKVKEMGIFGHLALLGKLAFSGKFDAGKKSYNDDAGGQSRAETGTLYDSVGQHNPLFEPSQSVETEVRLGGGGGTIVRPANLHVKKANKSTREPSHCNLNRELRASVGDETADTRNDAVHTNHGEHTDSIMISRIRGAPYSKSTSDLSPQKHGYSGKMEEETKFSRPCTLSFKGHNYKKKTLSRGSAGSLSIYKGVPSHISVKNGQDITTHKTNGYKPINTSTDQSYCEDDKDDSVEKIKMRIKTPQSEKRCRLSLYDDRLMCEGDNKSDDGTKLCKSSVSLQQLKSIDETHANVFTDCTC